jgi:hypothetical protein
LILEFTVFWGFRKATHKSLGNPSGKTKQLLSGISSNLHQNCCRWLQEALNYPSGVQIFASALSVAQTCSSPQRAHGPNGPNDPNGQRATGNGQRATVNGQQRLWAEQRPRRMRRRSIFKFQEHPLQSMPWADLGNSTNKKKQPACFKDQATTPRSSRPATAWG